MTKQFRIILFHALLAWGVSTSAGVITQIHGYGLGIPLGGPPNGTMSGIGNFFDTFDSTLGELTGVDVNITGSLQVVLNIPLNNICSIGCVPQPHTYNLSVNPDFGLSTPSASYIFIGSGILTNLASAGTFTHNYSFDESTDLVGFDLVSATNTVNSTGYIPPTIGSAHLDDFIGPVGNYPLTWLYPAFSYQLVHTSQIPVTGNINLNGLISLTYHYDEFEDPEEPVVSVAEPSSAALFLIGLLMLAVARFRKI